ncbi:ABC-type uncharacterized transport system substrate-binding protein [Natranaerovirga pectinivora]|uniref:ABC-type uncharacterized transport system substrate-binding protein n=1 Tax=Natranaerovirga pectinivora TaxID=682400 RepID=A0A4R3MIZ0_9FIRM|nr:ABC transporter substrate binding protein [Natranaerovirga pectinivora]TCT13850.1 ABC-type uncharacterized transport system substrate-binding protein [Natranaerovirga pectinivora]
MGKWYSKFVLASIIVILIVGLSACESNKKAVEDNIGIIEGDQNESTIEMEIPDKTFKVLHVMSYHTPWEWTETQLQGFKDGLGQDIDVEYKVIEMDAKNKSNIEWLEEIGAQARGVIDTWQPDLVFTSDDEAQEFVVTHYLNTDIPFVFCGVNKLPEEYGYDKSNNVTGVLEIEHFAESLNLLLEVAPDIKSVAVVFDDSPIWGPVEARMREQLHRFPEIEFPIWDTIYTYDEFQSKMLEYQDQVDAIGLIGIFNYKNENNKNVHYRDVLRWVKENSNLPDFSYWYDRASYGTLAVVSVSGYEQGLSAGKKARQILVHGVSPADIPMDHTTKGQQLISLARARTLDIDVSAKVLLSTEVKTMYEWER